MSAERSFHAVVALSPTGRVMVPLPFAPDRVWGTKPQHHVAGTIGTHRVRAVVEPSVTVTPSCSAPRGAAIAVSPWGTGLRSCCRPRDRNVTTWRQTSRRT